MSTTIPLLLVSVPLPQTNLISTCRKLLVTERDWLFLKSDKTLVAFQLNTHTTPIGVTRTIISETFLDVDQVILLDPALGFIQRPSQVIPVNAYTTIVRYRTCLGKRGEVIDLCRELFQVTEEMEFDVFSLAILKNVEDEDEFFILERYLDKDAEGRHLASLKCVECLARIKDMIVSHDSRSYSILDV